MYRNSISQTAGKNRDLSLTFKICVLTLRNPSAYIQVKIWEKSSKNPLRIAQALSCNIDHLLPELFLTDFQKQQINWQIVAECLMQKPKLWRPVVL